jgi:hypothetical protein
MFLGGTVLAGFMKADDRLAKSTHWNIDVLFIGYSAALVFLYGICPSSTSLRFIFIMWENLGDALGRTMLDFLWQLSGFVGFTLSTSGTTSRRWTSIGGGLFALFILCLAATIWPR